MTDLYGSRELSQREIRVVSLVADGMTNGEIARAMGTTDHVVKNYLRKIFDKTGMNSRLELSLWWTKQKDQ